ncbi:MAG TPA: hypothetical protein VIE42_09325 [Steroidobacteraceae bacterium]
MKTIPVTPLTLEVARRIIWFEPPETALASPARFMAYAMTYARHEDMRVIRGYVSDDDFREALDLAPPGIIDPRSWAYWNSKLGRYPAPPMPVRKLTDGLGVAERRSAEEPRQQARAAWLALRQEARAIDPEEVRRRAREEWSEKYGPKDGK